MQTSAASEARVLILSLLLLTRVKNLLDYGLCPCVALIRAVSSPAV